MSGDKKAEGKPTWWLSDVKSEDSLGDIYLDSPNRRSLTVNRYGFVGNNHDSAHGTSNIYDYYEINRKDLLGEGSYGKVVRAVDKSSGMLRAIKIMHKTKIKDLKHFKSEIEIMRSIDHPNILKLFETFEDEQNVYLVLEYCEGGELFERLMKKKTCTERETARMMRDIFSAVFYLHENGIVHRDIKPENFLFTSPADDSPLKMIDFGLASYKASLLRLKGHKSKSPSSSGGISSSLDSSAYPESGISLSSAYSSGGSPIENRSQSHYKSRKHLQKTLIQSTRMGSKVGTPYYVAPEVFLHGKEGYNEKCDLWSCGVLMYVLLVGHPPFMGSDEHKILRRVCRGKFKFPTGDSKVQLSDEAKDLICGLLELDVEKRLNAIECLNHPWLTSFKPQENEDICNSVNTKELRRMLSSFGKKGTLQKLGLNAVAFQKTDGEVGDIKAKFNKLDKNKDGTLCLEEFLEGLKIRKSDVEARNHVAELFDSMDVEGTGEVSYTEFLAVMSQKNLSRDILWRAFQVLDKDRDGVISLEEFQSVLGKADLDEEEILSKIENDISSFDSTGDGNINFSEFLGMFGDMTVDSKKKLEVGP
jgi:calcium-dependent protein kinase